MHKIDYILKLCLVLSPTVSFAAAGSGDSSVGSLDTQPPEVTSVVVTSTRQATITFNESVNDATIASNYSVNGGTGNLTLNPDTATSSGGNQYTVSWASGEMSLDTTISLVASNVSDALGNEVVSLTNDGQDNTIADAPNPGMINEPATASAAPISIPFSGASDTLSSIAGVELWYRFDDGGVSSWTNSGITVPASSGTFNFTPPGSPPATFGVYFFEVVAEDAAGNRSTEPDGMTGNGSGTTTFSPPASVIEWEMY